MTKDDTKTYGRLCAFTAYASTGYSGYAIASVAYDLMKLAKAARRECERPCNGIERWDATAKRMIATWTEADQEQHDKRIDRYKARIAKLLDGWAVIAETNRDPRGAFLTIRLTVATRGSTEFRI